jgi:hypothetical protein
MIGAALRNAAFGAFASALLASCSGEQPLPPPPDPAADRAAANMTLPTPAPAHAPPPAKAAEPVLTAEGFGPLRIGMTRAEVVAALGEDRNPDAVGGPDPASCDEFYPARAPEGLLVMIEAGKLTRISLVRQAKVKTDRALTLGAPAAAVRAAYGPELRAELHKYQGAPAQYLTAWAKDPQKGEGAQTPDTARGILHEIGGQGTVQRISAGGPSIRYVEGCA